MELNFQKSEINMLRYRLIIFFILINCVPVMLFSQERIYTSINWYYEILVKNDTLLIREKIYSFHDCTRITKAICSLKNISDSIFVISSNPEKSEKLLKSRTKIRYFETFDSASCNLNLTIRSQSLKIPLRLKVLSNDSVLQQIDGFTGQAEITLNRDNYEAISIAFSPTDLEPATYDEISYLGRTMLTIDDVPLPSDGKLVIEIPDLCDDYFSDFTIYDEGIILTDDYCFWRGMYFYNPRKIEDPVFRKFRKIIPKKKCQNNIS